MTSKYYIYIVSNRSNLIYIGLTNDVMKILKKHRLMNMNCSRGNFGLNKLVYVEEYHDVEQAVKREVELKSASRSFKMRLLTYKNPKWECIKDCLSERLERFSGS